jgi:hypothetical protein
MTWAHLEVFEHGGGVFRLFEDERKFGEPYERAFAFRLNADGDVEFVGITEPPTLAQGRAMLRAANRYGLKYARPQIKVRHIRKD